MTEQATVPTGLHPADQVPAGAPPLPPPAAPTPLPPVPEVVHVSPGAPQAEPGDATSEYKLVVAVGGLIAAAVGVFDASAATHLFNMQVDASVIASVNTAGAALETVLTTGYAFARSIRKQGTQG